MQKYEVNNKIYFTICSVHDEVIEIFNRLEKINPLKFESPVDLLDEVLKEIKLGKELIIISKEMGQKMEDSLNYRTTWRHSLFNPNIDEE